MTREEAVACLKGIKILGKDIFTRCRYDLDNAVDMAIKALEQEPCVDAVSRTEVKNKAIQIWNGGGDEDYKFSTLIDYITESPAVTLSRQSGNKTMQS